MADAEIDQAVQALADQNRPYEAKDGIAEKGDRVTISFQGTIDGQPFDGGSGEDVPVMLGSGRFLPGFEENLIGAKAGESRTFDIKFPDNYPATGHCRQDRATFAVTVKTVEAPGDGHDRRRFRQEPWIGIRSPSCATQSATAFNASTRGGVAPEAQAGAA